jgi:uncharacterized protein YkwD
MMRTVWPRLGAAHIRAARWVGAWLAALGTIGFAALPASAQRPAPRRAGARHAAALLPAGRLTLPHTATRAPTPRQRAHRRSAPPVARPACPNAHARIGRVARRDTERATVCLLNLQRAAHGLPALRGSRRLDVSAQRWTNVMVRDRAFSHGSDFASRISATGFNWSQVAENIATGFRTPSGAVRAWMGSLGHCENILSPEYRDVGAGFDTGSAEAASARHGTWTLDFGLLMGQSAPSRDWTAAQGCPY